MNDTNAPIQPTRLTRPISSFFGEFVVGIGGLGLGVLILTQALQREGNAGLNNNYNNFLLFAAGALIFTFGPRVLNFLIKGVDLVYNRFSEY